VTSGGTTIIKFDYSKKLGGVVNSGEDPLPTTTVGVHLIVKEKTKCMAKNIYLCIIRHFHCWCVLTRNHTSSMNSLKTS